MSKEFITEILAKPKPSPDPDIFEYEKINVHLLEDFKAEKIKIEKDINEIYYNHFFLNSNLFLHQIKKNNLSYHHLFFIFKLYTNCTNQKIIIEAIEKLYQFY